MVQAAVLYSWGDCLSSNSTRGAKMRMTLVSDRHVGRWCLAVAVRSRRRTSRAARDSKYPAEWWTPCRRRARRDWEILPQDAGPGEVILSKRNELGMLSNFAPTPFEFHGKKYASLEGFWQMMKYPEGPDDRAREGRRHRVATHPRRSGADDGLGRQAGRRRGRRDHAEDGHRLGHVRGQTVRISPGRPGRALSS